MYSRAGGETEASLNGGLSEENCEVDMCLYMDIYDVTSRHGRQDRKEKAEREVSLSLGTHAKETSIDSPQTSVHPNIDIYSDTCRQFLGQLKTAVT